VKKRPEGKAKSPEAPNYDPRTVSAFEVYQKEAGVSKAKKKNKATNKKEESDPLKGVASVSRLFGLQSLSKALDSLQYRYKIN